MSAVREVKTAVKESLVGTTVEPGLSQQARSTFEKYARHTENGESYMAEEDFVDAIAPEGEDYVSRLVRITVNMANTSQAQN